MERQVQFRDYQEQVAADHNNLQTYTRESLDSLVKDAVSAARRYSGLVVTKTGQVEVTVAPGKVYDGGAVFGRRTSLSQSMSTYTAAASRRIVAVSAYGQEVETDIESRDYLVNTETGETEPKAAAMTKSRDINIVFTSGAEATDPVPPALPVTHVVVAYITMDTTQVVEVNMVAENEVVSTDDLDIRTDGLEEFRAQVEPRVASLASDLASLQNQLGGLSTRSAFGEVFLDLARVKEALRFPDTASSFGSDFFLDTTGSDVGDVAGLGHDAKVEEGIRFADANADQFEISLFSANDPNASLDPSGILLPKYTEEVKIQTGAFASELGISQYGFQTHTIKTGFMSRSRLRYGGSYTQCSNGVYWNTPGQPPDAQGLYDFGTTGFTAVVDNYVDAIWGVGYGRNYVHQIQRGDTWWYDTWKEPFIYTETTDSVITGALVAQTFLVSNDMWSTKVGFYVTAKGANEDIHLALCEVIAGVPDVEHSVAKVVHPSASIVTGWNRVAIPPTFLKKGGRYALVVVSNANHKIGMAAGQSFLDGTFFYSTDGIYFQGDLTKDMMLEIWGAKFNSAQVAIEFAAISLDGGFRNIDILCEMWVPDSTELVWELRPNGTGEWLPLVNDNGAVLANAPPLAQFRARFVGTRDMAPALKLTGSRVKVNRPKTTFKHVTDVKTLLAATDTLKVQVLLERFDDSNGVSAGGTPHEFDLRLHNGTAFETADTVTNELRDVGAKRYMREYTFSALTPDVTTFRLVADGSTTSPQNTFHVAEVTYYSL